MSVDTPDLQPDSVCEDLSVNDIESIVEFVLENIMHIDNAIAEHDESDNQDGTTFDLKKIECRFQRTNFKLIEQTHTLVPVVFQNYEDSFYSSPFAEVIPQPPEA